MPLWYKKLGTPKGLALVIALAYLPVIAKYLFVYSLSANYDHLIVVWLVAVVLAIRDCDMQPLDARIRPKLARILPIVALVSFAAATLFHSLWLANLSLLLLISSFAANNGLWQRLWPALVLLLVSMPLPFGIDTMLMGWMQGTTHSISSYFLDSFKVIHASAGNVLELPNGKQLFVAEACGGTRSLFAIGSLLASYCLWNRFALSRIITLTASTFFFVLLANAMRVVLVVWASQRSLVDLTSGWKHELLGFAVFVIILLSVYSLQSLLLAAGLWPPKMKLAGMKEPEPVPLDTQLRKGLKTFLASLTYRWKAMPVFAALFLVLCIVQCIRGIGVRLSQPFFFKPLAVKLEEKVNKFSAESFAPTIGPFRQVGFEFIHRDDQALFGDHSIQWTYKKDQEVIVSLDFPFYKFHDLVICYRNLGWRVVRHRPIRKEGHPSVFEMDLVKNNGMRAIVLYNAFDSDSIPYPTEIQDLPRTFLNRAIAAEPEPKRTAWYQYQMLSVNLRPHLPSEREEVLDLYFKTLATVRENIRETR